MNSDEMRAWRPINTASQEADCANGRLRQQMEVDECMDVGNRADTRQRRADAAVCATTALARAMMRCVVTMTSMVGMRAIGRGHA